MRDRSNRYPLTLDAVDDTVVMDEEFTEVLVTQLRDDPAHSWKVAQSTGAFEDSPHDRFRLCG